MSEHHTHGRQGQGARRRRNNNYKGRPRRNYHADKAPQKAPSFLQRILSFFGLGPKKNEEKPRNRRFDGDKKKERNTESAPRRERNNKRPNRGGERKRMASTLPTEKARLYVGNLSFEVTESELEDLFKGFGNVRSVDIIYNPRTYKSKGYAFVEMYQLESARQAAEVLHGQPFMGRELMVSAASEKPAFDENEENAQDAEDVQAPESNDSPAEEKQEG